MIDREPEPPGLGPESVGQAEDPAPSQELVERTLNSFQTPPTTVGEVLSQSPRCANLLKDHPVRALITLHFHIPEFEQLRISLLHTQRSLFFTALKHQRVPPEERTRFRYAIHTLFTEATRLGWNADRILAREWESILPDARLNRCASLVMYFAGISVQPATLVRKQIDDWINERVIAQERTFSSAWQAAFEFTNVMLVKGYTNVDFIAAARFDDYATPLKDFTLPIRNQVQRLLAFRKNRMDGSDDTPEDEDTLSTADDGDDIHDPSKPKRRQVRAVTARTLECSICCLYGFLEKRNRGVHRLDQLFEEKSLNDYKKWLLTTHKIPATTLRYRFESLKAAVNQYPALKRRRKFLSKFMTQIPNEPDWKRRRRMADKTIPYENLMKIPDELRSIREQLVGTAPTREGDPPNKAVLRLATEEFLIRWLLELPWRARNICECRLGRNLKKAPIGPNSMLGQGAWMKAAQKSQEEFWQYSFSAEECKGKTDIEGLLPLGLVTPLEEYLAIRKVNANDPTYPPLFINAAGNRMGHTELYCIISGLTLRFAGKRASTKVLRDMFAFRYIQTNEESTRYDDLAKILWHSDPAITRKYYATQRDLRCGARLADKYLTKRLLRRTSMLESESGIASPEQVLLWKSQALGVIVLIATIVILLMLFFR